MGAAVGTEVGKYVGSTVGIEDGGKKSLVGTTFVIIGAKGSRDGIGEGGSRDGCDVKNAVGCTLGESVSVGDTVGKNVGAAVGLEERGDLVGLKVGDIEGMEVGWYVGIEVG